MHIRLKTSPLGHAFRRLRIAANRALAQHTYRRWTIRCEPALFPDARRIHPAVGTDGDPLFSIFTLVSEGNQTSLERTYESIQQQDVRAWEWILLNRAGVKPDQDITVQRLSDRDERVHYWESPSGKPFLSHASFQRCRGRYLMLLQQGGEFSPNMMSEVARIIQQLPQVDMIYFDQDEIERKTLKRRNPWFKPAWSPELLLSVDFTTPCFVRREGFTHSPHPEMDDLPYAWAWLLANSSEFQCVAHIPKILFHALEEGVKRPRDRPSDGKSTVIFKRENLYRRAAVSIIIPTRDRVSRLKPCIESLRRNTHYENYQVLLIDTGSTDHDTEIFYRKLSGDPRLRLFRLEGEFNYSAANNLGAQNTDGELLLFLNDDVEIIEGQWLDEMVWLALREGVGVVGAQLLFPNGMIQHAGIILGLGGLAGHVFRGVRAEDHGPFGHVNWIRNFLAVTGACMMVRREVFEALGGFDEGYSLAYSDIQFCLDAVAAGYRVVYTPHAKLIHHEASSRGAWTPEGDVKRAAHAFEAWIERGDPFYNPNLSTSDTYPRIQLSGFDLRQMSPRLSWECSETRLSDHLEAGFGRRHA